jgi:hypothetical protein
VDIIRAGANLRQISCSGDSVMRFKKTAAALALTAAVAGLGLAAFAAPPKGPAQFTADGKLIFPKDYRSWVYLSTGLDMSYRDTAPGAAHAFDSVFVNREAYDGYMKTGTWPDGTVMVLEVRNGQSKGSINQAGLFQTALLGAEVHVKDTARYKKDGWAFFPKRGDEPSKALPETSDCNVCHEQHGAVDTTFVQFYPTLIPRAQEMKTMSAAYLAEEQAKAAGK